MTLAFKREDGTFNVFFESNGVQILKIYSHGYVLMVYFSVYFMVYFFSNIACSY